MRAFELGNDRIQKNLNMKKIQSKKILSNLLFYLSFSFALVIFLVSWISSNHTPLPFQSFVIQSGSMEPSIMTGDIILIKAEETYHVKDVVTFKDNSQRVVTHRIIETTEKSKDGGSEEFVTQGDANQSPDAHPITNSHILGKVQLVIPKLGFAVAFAQTKIGIATLIGIPVVLIIYDELRKILAEIK